jgi:PASTA domain
MPETIHVPVLGNMSKSSVFAGGLAAVAVGGYMWYRHQKKVAAAAASSAGGESGYGYGGLTVPASYGYGTYGYGANSGYYGYGFGPSGLGAYGGGSGFYGYGYYGAGTGQPVAQQATTNAQWSQAAMGALTAAGYNGETVLAALGQYLLGHPLTADQTTVVESAIAAEGYPPVPGASGYPPAIQSNSPNGGGGGGGGGTKVIVPNVVGLDQAQAYQVIGSTGLKPTGPAPIKGKVHIVTAESPKAGSSVNKGSTVKLTSKVAR